MSAPPPELYLADGFEPKTLKIPQLRSILLAHGKHYPNRASKSFLVDEFTAHIGSQAPALRAAAQNVKPSSKGIVAVSENGDETPAIPAKRPRKSTRRATVEPDEPEPMPAVEEEKPPAKKPRARQTTVEVEIETPRKPRARAKKPAIVVDDVDEGVEAEIEDEEPAATPAPRTTRSRVSLAPSTPGPSVPSVPASSQRLSNVGSSSSIGTELRTPSVGPAEVKPPRSARKSEAAVKIMDHVREESEKEDEEPKKVVKAKTPRRSAGEESGFSDYNPFQSGGEGAAERDRRRRKSSIGVSNAVKKKPTQPRFSEPAPQAVATPPTSILRRVGPSRESLRTPPSDVKAALRAKDLDDAVQYNHMIQDKLNRVSYESYDQAQDTQVTVYTERDILENDQSLVMRANRAIHKVVPAPKATLPLSLLGMLLLFFVYQYQGQSAAIGFCDTGSHSNPILEAQQIDWAEREQCNKLEVERKLDNLPNIITEECTDRQPGLTHHLPQPSACAPCPQHAECADGQVVACAPEFILRPHPLQFLAPVFDGVPGFGPRAFPPMCKTDSEKMRNVAILARQMVIELRTGRGRVECEGGGDKEVNEVVRFGMEESALKDKFAYVKSSMTPEQYDEIFEWAIRELLDDEAFLQYTGDDNVTYLATPESIRTWQCQAKMGAEELASEYSNYLKAAGLLIAASVFGRYKVQHHAEQKYRAEELAKVALKRLQDQEKLHYTDPVTTPHPFIPRDQLRDLVLPPKGLRSHSSLWEKVVQLVEHNANVAVRDQELKGEIWKTWEWAGVGERHITWEE
ncbi:hypothetical protein IAT38_006100 [Cryptococcus sp. DSM 104549]